MRFALVCLRTELCATAWTECRQVPHWFLSSEWLMSLSVCVWHLWVPTCAAKGGCRYVAPVAICQRVVTSSSFFFSSFYFFWKGVSLEINSKRFAFVNMHLEAHLPGNFYRNLCSAYVTHFIFFIHVLVMSHAFNIRYTLEHFRMGDTSAQHRRLQQQFDHVFVFGDLNYRLQGAAHADIVKLCAERKFAELLNTHDQLKHQLVAGRFCACLWNV